jgi:hypothetical protein
MTNKEFAYRYLLAKYEEEDRNDKIQAGIELLMNGYSVIETLPYSLYSLYDDLVIEKIGEQNFNWLIWFLYDSNKDEKICHIDDQTFVFNFSEESIQSFVNIFIEN